METPNPTYLLEHLGANMRVTVRHVFAENERIEFTVLLQNTPELLAALHTQSFGRLKQLLQALP